MATEGLIRANTIQEDLQVFVSQVYDHFNSETKPINWKITDRRSLSANAQVWVWAGQISKQTGEDVETVYCRMKRDQALPILLSDPVNSAVTDYILNQTNFYKMNDSQQLKLVGAMEVTRTLSTRQHNEFRDNVQAFYNQHGFNLQYIGKEDGQ